MSLEKNPDKPMKQFEEKSDKQLQLASGDSLAHDKREEFVDYVCEDFKNFQISYDQVDIKQVEGKYHINANDDSGCYVNSETSSNSAENHKHEENNELKTNLIINYLPPTLTQEDVAIMFSECGNIESCKLICEKFSNESLGYAFVKYKSQEEAEKAITLFNGKKIGKKFIKVSYARPSSDEIKGANLYICNIPIDMKQVELESLFGQYGKIITARILFDSMTGLSRGIAFVRFDKKHQADLAIQNLNGYQLPHYFSKGYFHEPLIVKYANTPPILKSSMSLIKGFEDVNNSNETPFKGRGLGRNYSTPIRKNSVDSFFDLRPSTLAKKLSSNGWIISVLNLNQFTEEYQLWQLFGPFGAVQNVYIIRDVQQGLCQGFAFVIMNNYEEALFAIKSLNGYELNGKNIQISLKLPNHQHMREYFNSIQTFESNPSEPSFSTPLKPNFLHKKKKVSQSFIHDYSRLENILLNRKNSTNN